MTEEILRTGDQAIYNPQFGAATVVVRPGILSGTGRSNARGMTVCIEGDESSATVYGCVYIKGPYVGGTGTLSISRLGSDQVSRKTKSNNKSILLKGTTFQAKFQVTSPAMRPGSPPEPDSTTSYSGTGSFQTTNMTVKDNG